MQEYVNYKTECILKATGSDSEFGANYLQFGPKLKQGMFPIEDFGEVSEALRLEYQKERDPLKEVRRGEGNSVSKILEVQCVNNSL